MAASVNESTTPPALEPELTAGLQFPSGFSARTTPSWLAKKKVVGGFVVEPIEGGGPNAARHFAGHDQTDGYDLPVLNFAVQRAEALIQAKKTMLLFVPIYWACLDHARLRLHYLHHLSTLSEDVRHLLVFELAGAPEDLMPARFEERLNQLRPYCRSIIFRSRIGRRDLAAVAKLPIHAIGIDLGELPPVEHAIIPALDNFVAQVEKAKRHTYVHGLSSKSLLMAAQSAGVDFVAGPIIPSAGDSNLHSFEIADLYDLPRPGTGPSEP
jgi:hypothetical protein